jgi:hypothetical protein
MNKSLQIIDPIDYPGWDNLVISTGNYSFFHSANWAKVLNEAYRYKPFYFTSIDCRAISVMFPFFEIRSILTGKRGVSLPFSDYCQPIVNYKNNFSEILNYLIRFGEQSGWDSIEFRGGENLLKDVRPSSTYYVHSLDLARKEDDIFGGLRSSTRRNIRKALKEGVTVGAFDTLKAIEEFYRLNCMTRKRHGLPPQPFKFFKNIHRYIISKNQGTVLLASYGAQTIGAAIFFNFGTKALYKFGASDWRFQNLRGNNLIMWEAISRYSRQGYNEFSFGRTEPENSGLRQFKAGWGAKQHTLNYFKYDLKAHVFTANGSNKAGSYNRIFNKMPQPLLKLIGSLAYRHIG